MPTKELTGPTSVVVSYIPQLHFRVLDRLVVFSGQQYVVRKQQHKYYSTRPDEVARIS